MPSRFFTTALTALLFAVSGPAVSFAANALSGQVAGQTTSQVAQSPASESKERAVETLSLEARKKLLLNVVDISKVELDSLKGRLEKLELDDQWKAIRGDLLEKIPEYHKFYDESAAKINEEKVTNEDIKNLAGELKSWRQETFSPFLKETANIILIFEEENLLKIARGRLDKISEDIQKLEKQSFGKIDILKSLFSQAQKRLDIANELHNNAKNLLAKSLVKILPAEESTSTPETLLPAPTLETAPLPAEELEAAENELEIQDLIQDLVKKSFDEIKTTYEIFIKMSKTL